MELNEFYPLFLASKNLQIDSNKVEKNDLFFAFSGDSFNAATKAKDAMEKGAIAVIVEDQKFEDKTSRIFYVPSTLVFLQDLARFHRAQLTLPIIGLTGSNGKTTSKELMHAVLSQKFDVQYTRGNLNNHIGVPLSLLSIRKNHEIAVIEMGANHQKEIEFLSEMVQPTIGYITNFGKAHLEGFGGVEGVIKGKSELYHQLISHHQKILVNNADKIQREKTQSYSEKITFGTAESDYYFELIKNETFVGFKYKETEVFSQLTGAYNFANLCAAATFGFVFNVDLDLIKKGIENYQPTNMRSQIVVKEGKRLVLDTYNANPSSMAESLKNFAEFEGTKTVILGDMLELGEDTEKEHREIIALAQNLKFDEMICVGPNFNHIEPNFSFKTIELLKSYLEKKPIKSANILLKGSRGIALEKILEVL